MDEGKHRKSMKPVLKALKLMMEKFYIWYITMDGMSGKQEMYFLTIEISLVVQKDKINVVKIQSTWYMCVQNTPCILIL